MRFGGLVAALALTAAVPAWACRTASSETGILHATPPKLEPDQIVAKVEILRHTQAGNATVIEARVLKMIQGQANGPTILIRPEIITSCDQFERTGARGVVVGRVTGSVGDVLQIDPVRTLRNP
jgi:hypothetical protein